MLSNSIKLRLKQTLVGLAIDGIAVAAVVLGAAVVAGFERADMAAGAA